MVAVLLIKVERGSATVWSIRGFVDEKVESWSSEMAVAV